MANITVKNIPDEIYAKVKEAAKSQHRSVNSYVIDTLATTTARSALPRSPLEIIAEMKKLRADIGPLTGDSTTILRRIRDEGEMYEE